MICRWRTKLLAKPHFLPNVTLKIKNDLQKLKKLIKWLKPTYRFNAIIFRTTDGSSIRKIVTLQLTSDGTVRRTCVRQVTWTWGITVPPWWCLLTLINCWWSADVPLSDLRQSCVRHTCLYRASRAHTHSSRVTSSSTFSRSWGATDQHWCWCRHCSNNAWFLYYKSVHLTWHSIASALVMSTEIMLSEVMNTTNSEH